MKVFVLKGIIYGTTYYLTKTNIASVWAKVTTCLLGAAQLAWAAVESGYIGNFVTNHEAAFFVFDQ